MKLFKSKQSIKTNKRWVMMVMLFIGIGAVGMISCEKDDVVDPDTGGEEVESAYVREVYKNTPNGTIFYLDITDNLESDPDISKAVELGLNVRIYSIGKHPITISSAAKTITKWKVDKTTLEPAVEAILSYASTGINSTDITFVSETSAFINDLIEGIIVEFNPTTMEIVATHNVTPLEHPDNFSFGTKGTPYNGKIIFSVQWIANECCDYPYPLHATVGVFDPANGTMTYDVDERTIGVDRKPIFDENNTAYLPPAPAQNSWINHFFGANQDDMIVLKLNADGSIDDNFEINLKDELPNATYFATIGFVYQDNIVFTYSETPIKGSFDDRFATRNSTMEYKSAVYNLNTQETKPFTALDGYRFAAFLNTIDGVNYFRTAITSPSGNGYDALVIAQNGLESFTEVSSIESGGILFLADLW